MKIIDYALNHGHINDYNDYNKHEFTIKCEGSYDEMIQAKNICIQGSEASLKSNSPMITKTSSKYTFATGKPTAHSIYADNKKIICKDIYALKIDKAIFSNDHTIVFFENGDKQIVKCSEEDAFNPYLGITMCVLKEILGEQEYNQMKKDISKFSEFYEGGGF